MSCSFIKNQRDLEGLAPKLVDDLRNIQGMKGVTSNEFTLFINISRLYKKYALSDLIVFI